MVIHYKDFDFSRAVCLTPPRSRRCRPLISNKQLLDDLVRCAQIYGTHTCPQNFYQKHGTYGVRTFYVRFGSWMDSLWTAGLGQYEKPRKEERRPSRRLRYRVFKNDKFSCVFCGRNPKEDGVKLHADHIIPWSKGGRTVIENLQTLCADCNWGKLADL